MQRRLFLTAAGRALAATAAFGSPGSLEAQESLRWNVETDRDTAEQAGRSFNGTYRGAWLDQIAFPLGGIGAGMFCVEGAGTLSKFSFRGLPDLVTEHRVFAAIAVIGRPDLARILEGPVPRWKLRPSFPGPYGESLPTATWGLPRYHRATFDARFPFAKVQLTDDVVPIDVAITGWSPFVPADSNKASLPVATVEYRLFNRSQARVEGVFSFNTENLMARPVDPNFESEENTADRIRSTRGGFILYGAASKDHLWEEGSLAVWADEPDANVNHSWFRDQTLAAFQIAWNEVSAAACYSRAPLDSEAAPGASLYVPFSLEPAAARTFGMKFAWYVPRTSIRQPELSFKDGKFVKNSLDGETYQPWYAKRFAGIEDVKTYWDANYEMLRRQSETFSRTLFDTSFPAEVIEAVSANLSILKSPTVLRQTDQRFWAWEGCGDSAGAGGYGSCTHVWNYAQALAHLFPEMERSLRETEFGPNQGKDGFQAPRAALPIRPIGDTAEGRTFPAAADGQLGGIIKVHRDWRISGDTGWLRKLWPKIRASLDFCIRTWDPNRKGSIEEPHLNTYDVKFWGPDSMAMSLYVGALHAAVLMGNALGDDVVGYRDLLSNARTRLEGELFNGEFFIQKVEYKSLRAKFPGDDPIDQYTPHTPQAIAIFEREGPPFQYGPGCLSDGVLGAWLSLVCGAGEVLDRKKVESHLSAVYRNNLKRDFTVYPNAARPEYACGEESGLVVCSWPNGGRPSLQLIYSDEVWTGIEYQVASHMIMMGMVENGLELVRHCRRRYDGRVRNPFSEIEAGHWYARALSSYGLLQALSGARYDAGERILYLTPTVKGDFRCFLATATGYGTVGVRNRQPFLEVVWGTIPYKRIEYTAST
jgi:uncharacterized protein (DUF608 family)